MLPLAAKTKIHFGTKSVLFFKVKPTLILALEFGSA
jgi:hypothetical protein